MSPDAPRPSREPPPAGTVRIRCRTDGPLVVEVAPDLAAQGVRVCVTAPDGTTLMPPDPDKPPALCRCGASATKPFCDGSHRHNGFEASGTSPGPAAPSA